MSLLLTPLLLTCAAAQHEVNPQPLTGRRSNANGEYASSPLTSLSRALAFKIMDEPFSALDLRAYHSGTPEQG